MHGDDADNLTYSMCFLHSENKDNKPDFFDNFLTLATGKKEYLVHKLFEGEKPAEEAVH